MKTIATMYQCLHYGAMIYSIRFDGYTVKATVNGEDGKEVLTRLLEILTKYRVPNEIRVE